MQRNPGARGMQAAGNFGADAAGGTGDQDDGIGIHWRSIASKARLAAAKPNAPVRQTEEP